MRLRKIGPHGAWASALWEIEAIPGSRVFRQFGGGWCINFHDRSPSPLRFPARKAALEALQQGAFELQEQPREILGELL